MPGKRVIIAGGGIIGLATAYRMGRTLPRTQIILLEKEQAVGQHQTGNNSGVLHAGLYYKPGSNKARLAVDGIRKMATFAEENGIPHEICGKLVTATTKDELPRLDDLFERGTKNGLRDLRRLGPEEIREIEPHAAGLRAIRVPEEGIIDYKIVCETLAAKIREQGGTIVTGAKVTALRRAGSEWAVESSAGPFTGDFLLNCAGLHCDRVAQLAGSKREVRIVPFRGEYYRIKKERQHLVRHLIYPVPDPKFPFLGVHFTRLIRGGIEAGPNAVLAFAREGYKKTDVNLADLFDALSYKGLWNFLRRYPRMCFDELRRSFSRDLFCASLQKLVPEIQPDDLEPGGAGVRAQALYPNGELVQDFEFVTGPQALHLINAPSPGATASLAIGDEIVSRARAEIG